MKFADYIVIILSIELLIIGLIYGYERDWVRCGYYLCTSILNLLVVFMK